MAWSPAIVRSAWDAPPEPTPQTLDEFLTAATAALAQGQVPGAGIALVRRDGIEWAGGIGVADVERQTPVTADTHFRAGAISKTFVAMALVQMSEDGLLTLDDRVSDLVPDLAIDNPWRDTDPIRIVHLLQHTAGLEDTHFAETYNRSGVPDLPMSQALRHVPSAQRVRWRPGTSAGDSDPGYGLAGLIIERLTERPFEDYIRAHTFAPLGMTTSSFRLTPEDERTLARGYAQGTAVPVGFPQTYLRPANNLHTSARELGTFVQMLLNWGELGQAFVVDPEYLGSMERPRTTLASTAGLRNGFGSGIATWIDLPYPMLGLGGDIDGFVAGYGYSPARDVGFVVLLNRDRAGATLHRIMTLATLYLKQDTEPPPTPDVSTSTEALRAYEGYYHETRPRQQLAELTSWLGNGFSLTAAGETLRLTPTFGPASTLVPVSDGLFRLESQVAPTRVFTRDGDGTPVMVATYSGGEIYALRRPRWRVEIVRWPVLIAAFVLVTPLFTLIAWLLHARRAQPSGFWSLKGLLIAIPLTLAAPLAALAMTPASRWGLRSTATVTVFLGTLALPVLAVAALIVVRSVRARHASRALVTYGAAIAGAALIVTAYLASFGAIGVRLWRY